MCGITGLFHLNADLAPPSRSLLRAMVCAIEHRGPDEFGYYRDARVGLGHARLSIVDLSSGQQPMSNEDDAVWVVFNGEIFNFVELRAELEALGHRFKTHSDTEVIVHAWESWGEAAFVRFNGQFAIALYDTRQRCLVLSRDRLGKRPLFLHSADGVLRFASEVKAIFADPRVRRALSPAGVAETFTFWGARAPTTVFEGVEELRPGYTRVYQHDGSAREAAYWQPDFPRVQPRGAFERDLRSLDACAEGLRERLQRAADLRMLRADVPVGAYLSGGIDSSYIATLARHAAPGRFHTFSLRFEDPEYDETPYQRLMVSRLDSEHHEVVARRQDIAEVFPTVVWHAEKPLLRTGPAPLFLLSRLVREVGLKVVLTGEGSDEILGGYDIFREAKVRRYWARSPDSACRPRLFERLYPYLSRSPAAARGMALSFWQRGLDKPDDPTFSHGPRWSSAQGLMRYFSAGWRAATAAAPDPVAGLVASLPAAFAQWDPLGQAQYLEMVTLLAPYILSSQGDRMLMGNSVEGRFPFLDSEVIDFANALPARWKLNVLDEKHILKQCARAVLPAEILSRPKQPYRAPDALCFVSPDAPEWVREVTTEAALADTGVFDPRAVAQLLAKGRKRAAEGDGQFSNADNMAVVGVLSTQLLDARLVKAAPRVEGPAVTFRTVIDRVAG
ncbi:MAG: asparagine synthase (glutamine-hydrolyzing) [Myxococcales bacterium]|nr:asparagine synthase (glutamine-hydrolyzing) [Myxococcales bacterium]